MLVGYVHMLPNGQQHGALCHLGATRSTSVPFSLSFSQLGAFSFVLFRTPRQGEDKQKKEKGRKKSKGDCTWFPRQMPKIGTSCSSAQRRFSTCVARVGVR